jgi:hypothetical protein
MKFISNTSVETYQEARRLYGDALRMQQLGGRIQTWRQLMNSGQLDRSVTMDPEDATLALALAGDLRDGRDVWDDPDTYKRKVAAAPVQPEQDFGPSYGLASLRDLGRLVNSIDTPQFEQLRKDPVKTAYGLRLMVQATFLETVLRDPTLPLSEAAMVVSAPSFGYVFRKRLPPSE